MSPYEQMAEKYRRHPQDAPFADYIAWHMAYGFVFATPEYFVMGRPVTRSRFHPDSFDAPAADNDCWYVHAMAGNVSKVWDILPYPLGWVAFERSRGGKLELQIVELERLRRLCSVDNGQQHDEAMAHFTD